MHTIELEEAERIELDLLLEGVDPSFFELFLFLIRASHEGHLCIREHNGEFQPDPGAFFDDEALPYLEKAWQKRFLLEGHPLIKLGKNCLYLQKNELFEDEVLHALKRHIANPVAVQSESTDLSEKLLIEQKSFVKRALNSAFFILAGGPGTGKTFTVSSWLRAVWEGAKEGNLGKIALAAPTGKAAANLALSLMKQHLPQDLLDASETLTVHRLLGMRGPGSLPYYHKERPLPYSVVLVDECSMLDARMMAYLFAALQPGSRLVLLGDPDQLPPVESGQILPDLIDFFPERVEQLKKCMRVESLSILSLAQAIQKGNTSEAWSYLQSGNKEIIYEELPSHNALIWLKAKWEQSLDSCPNTLKEAELFYQKSRLLTPLRKGVYGVDSINQVAFECALQKKVRYLPIMISENDAQQELYNGDQGIIECHTLPLRSYENKVYFPGKEGQSSLFSPKFELAFCLSIHKSQGSEYDEVEVILPERGELFGREALYTAVTRAKKKLRLCSSQERISEALKRSSRKISGFF